MMQLDAAICSMVGSDLVLVREKLSELKMHHFLVEMCGSCLKQDVPLFEAMEEYGPNFNTVKNSIIIRNLFRNDFGEDFHKCMLCEDCSILLKGAIILENNLISRQLIYSNYLKMLKAHSYRSMSQFSMLSVQIQDNRRKQETLQETTECTDDLQDNRCANTEMQLDAETFDNDMMDIKDFKIDVDESSYEKLLHDFRCETINEKIEAKKENVMESPPAVIIDGCKVNKLSNEIQKDGSSEFPPVNVGTAMDAVEHCTVDGELKAANSNCQKKSLKINTFNQKSSRKRLLLAHSKADSDIKPYKCNWCVKSFSYESNYNFHRRIHTGEKPYKCNLCSKSFSAKSNYDTHRRTHTGEKPYKCDLCAKAFAHKSSCKTHRRIHTGEKPYKCNWCVKSFSHKSNYNFHRRIHTGEKPYKCDLCAEAFANKSSCKKHRRIHTGEKPYKCDLCAEAFAHKSSCKTHRRIHTGEKPYKCDLCAEAFANKSSCKTHRRIHTGEKPYKCDLCAEAFAHKSSCKTHRRIHTGEKPYKCNLCAKRFSVQSNFAVHRRIHTGEKPYKCNLCAKRFSVQSNFVVHRRIHTGEKPHKCDLCGKVFTQKSHYDAHRRRVHTGEKPFKM